VLTSLHSFSDNQWEKQKRKKNKKKKKKKKKKREQQQQQQQQQQQKQQQKHVYLEKHQHSSPTKCEVALKTYHPALGTEKFIEAADAKWSAMLFEFKQLNAAPLLEIQNAYVHVQEQSSGSAALKHSAGNFTDAIREGRHFAVTSFQHHQHHSGEGGTGDFHTDQCNSFLHLGMTIRGSRTLNLERQQQQQQQQQQQPQQQQQFDQFTFSRGDMYVACPVNIPHFVHYADSEVIFAAQVRSLMSAAAVDAFDKNLTPAEKATLMAIPLRVLNTTPFIFPVRECTQSRVCIHSCGYCSDIFSFFVSHSLSILDVQQKKRNHVTRYL